MYRHQSQCPIVAQYLICHQKVCGPNDPSPAPELAHGALLGIVGACQHCSTIALSCRRMQTQPNCQTCTGKLAIWNQYGLNSSKTVGTIAVLFTVASSFGVATCCGPTTIHNLIQWPCDLCLHELQILWHYFAGSNPHKCQLSKMGMPGCT